MKQQDKALMNQVGAMLGQIGVENPNLVSEIVGQIGTGQPLTLQGIASPLMAGYVQGQDAETDEEMNQMVRDLKQIRDKGLFSKLEKLR